MAIHCPDCGASSPADAAFCGECGARVASTTDERACPRCGRDNEPGLRFCHGCGHALAVDESASPLVLSAGRYVLGPLIGEGTRKRVYRARDTRLHRDVAIALVLDRTDERVRREAQIVARLGVHPNIVMVHDIVEDRGRPYAVMQMDGGTLEQLLDASQRRRLPADRAIRIARDVLRALAHAHANGIVHRDVKPGNIWLTASGDASLGDFGLAARAGVEVPDAGVAGTPAYMAPEQAVGATPDPRSDLYSLGCLLYEMLCGHPPFQGPDALAVISQQLRAPAPGMRAHDDTISEDLDAAALRMLAKSADDRYETASQAADALGAAGRAMRSAPGPQRPAELAWGRFVGRAEQLARLTNRVDEAIAGAGGLVLVGGEPGIGKSRLAEETCVYARLQGVQVVRGVSHEARGSLPYLPVVEILRALAAGRETHGDLAANPEVGRLLPEATVPRPDASDGDPEQDRFRLFEHVTSFLLACAERVPLLVVVEDLQWADAPTMMLLTHLASRVRDARLLIVGTFRDDAADRRGPLVRALADLRRERSAERITVRGLGEPEVRELLRVVLHADDRTPLAELASLLYRETSGNPFFLEELLRHLVESGALRREGAVWTAVRDLLDEPAIPQSVREVVGRRLERLSAPCGRTVAHAAVLGRACTFTVLQRMTGLDTGALSGALEEATRARVLSESSRGGVPVYAFVHALVRQALYEDLSLPRKQRLHLRAAEAIEATHAADPAPYLGEVAAHYRLAGAAAPADKAVTYSLRAADAAVAVFAWEEGASHLEAVLEIEEERGATADRLASIAERLGDLLTFAGLDPSRGVSHLEQALKLHESLGRVERAVRLHCRLGRDLASFWAIKDLARARTHLEAASAKVGELGDPSLECALQLGLASAAVAELRTADGIAAAARARNLADELGLAAASTDAAVLGGWLAFTAGKLAEGLGMLEDAWKRANTDDNLFVAYTAALYRGRAAWWLRDPRDARTWYERELAARAGRDAPRQRRFLVGELVAAHATAGELDVARRLIDDPDAHVRGSAEQGTPIEAQLWYLEGEWGRARDAWSELRALAGRRGDRWGEWVATMWLAKISVFDGDERGALGLLERALELVDGAGPPFEIDVHANLALLHAENGRPDAARVHAGRCRALLDPAEDWRGLAALADFAEAACDASSELYERAIARFRTHGLVWDEVDALHMWGRALLAAGDAGGAASRFDEALALLRRVDAGAPWLDRVLTDSLRLRGLAGAGVSASIDTVAREVRRERPDLGPHAARDGTLTIMFTDIEGSTEITEALGDEQWVEILQAHNETVRREVRTHGGHEVKSRGDGFMVVFADPAVAVQCAAAIQRGLRSGTVRVRIGIHTGQAIFAEDDFFGRDVNLAARIAESAVGGEILVSDRVVERAPDAAYGPSREVGFSGVSGTTTVVPVAIGR